MRKFFIGTDFKESPLIAVSILAIISIILHLAFPQHILVVKADKYIEFDIMQENSFGFKNPILIGPEDQPADKLAKTEEQEKQSDKILAVQVENRDVKKNLKENSKTNKTEEIKVKNKKLVTVTAYSSTVDQCDSTPLITASGTHVHDGTIAANFLKFGTKVKFPSLYGDKIFIVEDRMKSNYKVDIWFPTRQEAINFGAKRVEIEIL